MCGEAGVVSREQVVNRLRTAASRMQNRGERSTAMVTFDARRGLFSQYGEVAPPEVAYHNLSSTLVPGCMGIVHTRYATTGSTSHDLLRRNMQPYFSPSMAIAGNGDMVSAPRLRQQLLKQGEAFSTENDIEIMHHLLQFHWRQNHLHKARHFDQFAAGLFASVDWANSRAIGAWSNVVLLPRGLLAFRDPHGIRPLVMAQKHFKGSLKEVMVASETSVFNAFGGEYEHPVEIPPGGAVFVTRDLKIFVHEPKVEREAFCFFEFVYFARADSKFKGRRVEMVRRDLGRIVAQEYAHMRGRIDAVIGIPGSALSAATAMAAEWGVENAEGAVIKVGNKRSFQETTQQKRQRAIDDKFLFIRELIQGRRIAIIDDSNMRGNTGTKIIKRLFDLGARDVHCFFFTPPVAHSCFYGIDTPDPNELIAHRCDCDSQRIASDMGATSVNYISIDGLLQGVGLPKDELCLACINGDYPTPVEDALARQAERSRQRGRSCG